MSDSIPEHLREGFERTAEARAVLDEVYRAAADAAKARGYRLWGVEARLGEPEALEFFGEQ